MGDHARCDELFEGLSLLADGETAGARCLAVLDHLGGCEPCRRYLDSLRATRAALGAQASAPALDGEEAARLLEECRRALALKCPGLFTGEPSR